MFPREQLLYLNFIELQYEPHVLLRRIAAFLEVDADGFPTAPIFENRGQANDEYPAPTAADVEHLGALFKRDVREFVCMTGLDVSAWRSPRFLE